MFWTIVLAIIAARIILPILSYIIVAIFEDGGIGCLVFGGFIIILALLL